MPQDVLENGSFDGGWVEQDGISQLKVFVPWRVWWKERLPADPESENFRPEAAPIDAEGRYRTPPTAQKIWTQFATHTAGLLQGPIIVPAGKQVTFQAYVRQYSENPDGNDGEGMAKIGIDPTGGTDPYAESVVWSEDLWKPYEGFTLMQVEATSFGAVTVFTYAAWKWPAGTNDTYWDDAKLLWEQGPTPPPSPEDNEVRLELKVNEQTVYAGLFEVVVSGVVVRPKVVLL